ncbi:MAG: hypothetical protein JW874_14485 [Spirochaetales bacterium]|nr:hypothetical protein [Spirochaetales bacterium]
MKKVCAYIVMAISLMVNRTEVKSRAFLFSLSARKPEGTSRREIRVTYIISV